MSYWKRAAALLLTLCMTAALLTGCGKDPNDENKLSVVMTGGVATVDPAMATTAAERTTVLHLFDNLYRLTADGAAPAAAQSCQQQENEDGTVTYTFRLRTDAKWSDGGAVTAQDFVYAWRRLVSPELDSPNAEILSMVAGYEDARAGDDEALAVAAEGDHTLTVTLSASCPYFLDSVCTSPATMPVRQDAVDRGGEEWATTRTWFVSNGPYRRTGDWNDGQFVTLLKQSSHYDARRIWLDRIEILFKSEADAAAAAGSAEVVIGAAGEDGAVGGDPTVGVLLINQMATNMERTELRRALSLSVDRNAAAKQLGDDYIPAPGLVPQGIRTTAGEDFRAVNGAVIDNDPETYDRRCEQASELMRQAGLVRPEALASLGTVTLLYRNTPAQSRLARQLQQTWQSKLSLTVTLQGADEEEYRRLLTGGEFTLALTELTSLWGDAAAYLDLWCSGGEKNYPLLNMNAYDILMRVAADSTSAEARDAYLKDAEGLLLDSANVIPLYGRQQPYQISGSVVGVLSDGLGAWYFGGARRVTK